MSCPLNFMLNSLRTRDTGTFYFCNQRTQSKALFFFSSKMILIKCLIKLNFEPRLLLSGERFHCFPAGEKQLYCPPLNRYLNLSRKGK